MTDTPTSAPARPHRLNLALLVALAALAATGWQWYDTRQLLHTAELDLARKVATADGMSQSAKAAQAQTRQTLDQLSARLAQQTGAQVLLAWGERLCGLAGSSSTWPAGAGAGAGGTGAAGPCAPEEYRWLEAARENQEELSYPQIAEI